MSFVVREVGPAVELASADGTVRAEVWPGSGFNCLRWQVGGADLLYCDPAWETNPVPTRSGHPILFPFPNRLREGRIVHEGREYQLPRNEANGANAIHGFTPRAAWRVIGTAADATSASITGQFQLSKESPANHHNWPADFILTLTYTLSADTLAVNVEVENPDERSLPFGIGFHPYFCFPDRSVEELLLHATANTEWVLDGSLPTGERRPVPPDLDFRTPRFVGPTVMDALFTNLGFSAGEATPVATLTDPFSRRRVSLIVPPAFRELLLFTPPHRRAVAIEPYTCATDAAHQTDAGWRVLPAGGRFASFVRYAYSLAG